MVGMRASCPRTDKPAVIGPWQGRSSSGSPPGRGGTRPLRSTPAERRATRCRRTMLRGGGRPSREVTFSPTCPDPTIDSPGPAGRALPVRDPCSVRATHLGRTPQIESSADRALNGYSAITMETSDPTRERASESGPARRGRNVTGRVRALLGAADPAFAARGWARTRVEDIASAAGRQQRDGLQPLPQQARPDRPCLRADSCRRCARRPTATSRRADRWSPR